MLSFKLDLKPQKSLLLDSASYFTRRTMCNFDDFDLGGVEVHSPDLWTGLDNTKTGIQVMSQCMGKFVLV